MKSLFTACLLACCFIAPTFISAEEKKKVKVAVDPAKLDHPVKAHLFKIEGNGLEKPSWLFGTIHLGNKNVVNLHPNVQNAYDKADAIYTEIDMDPASQMAVLPLMLRKDGQTLKKALGPELAAELQEALTDINPALKVNQFNTMKTWVIAVTLPLLKQQLKMEQPLDAVLYQNAAKEGKTVGALETAQSQVQVFDQFSEEEIQSLLKDTLKSLKEDKEAGDDAVDSLTKLLNVYLTEDIYELGRHLNKELKEMDAPEDFKKRFIEALLDKRNVGMADKADEFMQATPGQSHFFAVGAGHYTGKNTVQEFLEKKGYKITEAFE